MFNNQNQNYIFSTAKSGLLVSWLVAIVFSLVTYPIITKGFDQADNMGVVLILSIFPLLALVFGYFAIVQSIALYTHGKTPLVMDPPIGNIGGQVGGAVLFNKRYRNNARFRIILSSLHIYTIRKRNRSGDGYSTKTHTDVLWQEEGYATLTQIEDYTRLEFLFHVPKGLEPSGGDFYWRLEVQELDGSKSYMREFFIPVEKGTQKAKYLKEDSSTFTPKGAEKTSAFTLVPLTLEEGIHTLDYPSYTDKLGLQGMGIFGGIFLVIGLGIFTFAQAGVATLVSFVLSLAGMFIISFGLYDFLVERKISFDETKIRADIYLFGMKIKEVEFALDEKVQIGYRDMFKQKLKPKKKGKVVLESFTSLVVTREDKIIYLAKYIKSIKNQRILMTYFKKALKI